MRKQKGLVFGVGFNDANYVVQRTINGKRYWCKIYEAWHGMLKRCYSEKALIKRPQYIGCSVSEDWHLFSNFKRWMEIQDWQGKLLDKDILIKGNKIYSESSCVFVSQLTNSFVNEQTGRRGDLPIGVSFHGLTGKFQATCSNPFTKRPDYLGLHTSPSIAHIKWKSRKLELACKLAELQTDPRVAEALRTRYL